MARPRLSEGRDTRRALLDAGLEMFAEKGYFGTTLREIARAVGVRESALYHYFPGKDALFSAILEDQTGASTQLTRLLDEPIDDVRAFLHRIGKRILDHFSTLKQRRLHRIIMSDGMRLAAAGRINLLERMGAGAAAFTQLIARLVADGHLRKAPAELLAIEFMAPLMTWRHMLATLPAHPAVSDPEAFVQAHVDHFLTGARAARTSK